MLERLREMQIPKKTLYIYTNIFRASAISQTK